MYTLKNHSSPTFIPLKQRFHKLCLWIKSKLSLVFVNKVFTGTQPRLFMYVLSVATHATAEKP